jgi:aspartate racemase
MGPAATIDFMSRVLSRHPVARDQDQIRLIVDMNPQVPDRNAAVAGTGESPASMLAAMAQGLARAGADFIVMPCNAAHAFAGAVRAATPLPFIDIIEASRDVVLAQLPNAKRAGVLGATGCLDARLYPKAFAGSGVAVLSPEDGTRAAFMDLLYRIKAGDTGPAVRAGMRGIAMSLIDAGAEAIVAGCTEVPLVLDSADLPLPLINTSDVLADCVIAHAGL